MRLYQLVERTLLTDATFVQSEIYNNYDVLTSMPNFEKLIGKLNVIFNPYNITFEKNEEGLDRYEMSRVLELGLVNSEAFPTGEISVRVCSLLYDAFQNDKILAELIVWLSGAIRHELVHIAQYQRSDNEAAKPYHNSKFKKLEPYQQYLADPHEIYAMATEIIEELQRQHISKDQILDAIKKTRAPILFKSRRYTSIFKEFNANDPLKIFQRLKKTIFQVLVDTHSK